MVPLPLPFHLRSYCSTAFAPTLAQSSSFIGDTLSQLFSYVLPFAQLPPPMVVCATASFSICGSLAQLFPNLDLFFAMASVWAYFARETSSVWTTLNCFRLGTYKGFILVFPSLRVVESTTGYTFTPCVGYCTSPGIDTI